MFLVSDALKILLGLMALRITREVAPPMSGSKWTILSKLAGCKRLAVAVFIYLEDG